MRATIFGTGYVGLIQAAVLAEIGHHVLCVDVDREKIRRLSDGDVPIYEPGLAELVERNNVSGRLQFTTDAEQGVDFANLQFVAVGTPPGEDGSADLRHVLAVTETIADLMRDHKFVVIKSTVPVGTGEMILARMRRSLEARGKGALTFDVASNPEFLREGSGLEDCIHPDRIILGTSKPETESILRELYSPLALLNDQFVVMSIRSAELSKYAANCMLAAKISFMNEIAGFADILGADVAEVRRGIGSDPRIGFDFINAGIGYGGSCFPKDVRAMIETAENLGLDAGILQAVERRNSQQKRLLVDKMLLHFDGDLRGRTFALWGLSFKPETDDMREASSRSIMEALWASGAKVRAYDPVAMSECRRLYPDPSGLVLVETKEEAVDGADALVLVTEWHEFLRPDFRKLASILKEPVIFDGRNVYDPTRAEAYGVTIYGVGRQSPLGVKFDPAEVRRHLVAGQTNLQGGAVPGHL